MLKRLDVRFFFFLRGTYASREGKNPIILRIIFHRQIRDIFTGLYCYKQSWVNRLRKVSSEDPDCGVLNSNMELILHKAMEEYDRLHFQNRDFTIGELVNNIRSKDEPPQTLQEYLSLKMTELRLRLNVDITNSTLKKYKSTFRHLENFLKKEYKSTNIALPAITPALINKLFSYLRLEKNISHNTSMNYMKTFKTILGRAVQDGLLKANPFNGFKMSFQKIYVDFLTEGEVQLLANLPLLQS